MQRILTVLALSVFFALPSFAAAQFFGPLVPCDGVDVECMACHVVDLGQNIINFLVSLASFLAVMLFAYAGFLMISAAGNMSKVERAKEIFGNVIIGMIIVLVGWLVVDTVMKWAFVGSPLDQSTVGRDFGPWNAIKCVEKPDYRNPLANQGRVTVGGGTDATLTGGDLVQRANRSASYKDQLCQQAAARGIGDQCANLQAVLAIESNANPGAVSPVGAVGLLQVMPSTAKILDPSLNDLTDAQVIEKLKDPSYNIELGVQLYARDYQYYGGDTTKVLAAYNGGRGANMASKDCPGQMRWQCEWDSPGCYGTGRTDCVPNKGYVETRNYVTNVANVAEKIAP